MREAPAARGSELPRSSVSASTVCATRRRRKRRGRREVMRTVCIGFLKGKLRGFESCEKPFATSTVETLSDSIAAPDAGRGLRCDSGGRCPRLSRSARRDCPAARAGRRRQARGRGRRDRRQGRADGGAVPERERAGPRESCSSASGRRTSWTPTPSAPQQPRSPRRPSGSAERSRGSSTTPCPTPSRRAPSSTGCCSAPTTRAAGRPGRSPTIPSSGSCSSAATTRSRAEAERAATVAEAANRARDLANTGANELTPERLADRASRARGPAREPDRRGARPGRVHEARHGRLRRRRPGQPQPARA